MIPFLFNQWLTPADFSAGVIVIFPCVLKINPHF